MRINVPAINWQERLEKEREATEKERKREEAAGSGTSGAGTPTTSAAPLPGPGNSSPAVQPRQPPAEPEVNPDHLQQVSVMLE